MSTSCCGSAPTAEDAATPAFRHRIRAVDRGAAAPAPTDAELLARCRARDARAWDVLVGRYERLIYSVALRNGVTEEDAADITQNTFATLLTSLDRLRDEERLASWLMTVARRQSWRARNLSRRSVPLDLLPDRPMEEGDWDAQIALHTALAELGGPCRTLLELLYLDPERPGYAQIASTLRRSVGGIGPMRGRCLARLRQILGELDGEAR